jgi:argininosuccinate synthase
MSEIEKVVLAYSGGLDTTAAIPWLKEKYGYDVAAVLVDVGRSEDLEVLRNRAVVAGAMHTEVVDAKNTFAEKYLSKALKANALYEGKYPLVSALSRPLISQILVEEAQGVGASAIAHGCTGKGNDQVRFTLSIWALAPEMKVIAPIREWEMTRQDAIDYIKEKGVDMPVKKESAYSIDQNLWGRAAECGPLEDPNTEPPEDAFAWTVSLKDAPDKEEYVELTFEAGIPVALNGEKKRFAQIIESMDEIGSKHGFGRIDKIENRLVGIKSREVYECPGALALIEAHKQLEDLVLDKDTLHYKGILEQRWAELVYNGMWFSPLKESIDAFIEITQPVVSGTVKLKFYKGNCVVAGRRSDNSLYDLALATYDKGDVFSHKSAEGFIELWGLPIKVWANKHKKE